ncbi:hypothetical protein ACRAWF_00290 [Streptomyces sp. L7]
MSDAVTRDAVDDFMGQWAAQRTDLDLDAMGTIGRVLRLSRLVNTRLKEYFAQYDMETWEFDVLATLRRSDRPLTAKALASSVMIGSAALTNRVDRLVAPRPRHPRLRPRRPPQPAHRAHRRRARPRRPRGGRPRTEPDPDPLGPGGHRPRRVDPDAAHPADLPGGHPLSDLGEGRFRRAPASRPRTTSPSRSPRSPSPAPSAPHTP